MRVAVALALALVGCSKSAPSTSGSAAPQPAVAAPVTKGTVEKHHFASKALGVDKQYVLYLPAGYADAPSKRWPVFYYLHGLTGNEQNWTEGGKLDEAADTLGLAAIVVMPDGDDGFYVNGVSAVDYDQCMSRGTGLFMPGQQPPKQTCVRKRDYETYIVDDLVTEIDSKYRTLASREGRAIAGLSMGGFGALQLSMRHPDLFAAAASHSGIDTLLYGGPYPYVAGKVEILKDPKSWIAGAGEIGAWVGGLLGTDIAVWRAHDPALLVDKLEPGKPALYLDCGTDDVFQLQNGMQYLHERLVANKVEHAYYIGPGKHDFSFWTKRVPESLKFLRDHTSGARP